MKRMLPLFLLLAAGQAQADSNSDYRAGSDFAHQIKGQGTGSIRNFNPQESIPGYNANPDETKYYGGVTAGGDSGLKNDGTTQWATGETTVEEYCTRTATITGDWRETTEVRTYTLTAFSFSRSGKQIVFSVTVPEAGTISSASLNVITQNYLWNSRAGFMNTIFNMTWGSTITLGGATGMMLSKGQILSGTSCSGNGSCTGTLDDRIFNELTSGRTTFTLTLVMQVKDREWIPRVEWVESCPFNKADGVLKGTECSEPGGTKTGVMEGKPWSLTEACWAYRDKYVTQSADNGTCQAYVDNPACTLATRQCAFYSGEGTCLHEYATYSCESKTSGKVMICGGDVFCLDGECDKAQSGKSNDFGEAVSQLAALAAAGKDVAALNGIDVRAFTGQAKFCKKAAAGYSNCCKDSGWGQDIGLAKCSSDEKALAKAKTNKLTVSVGEFCSKKVLGVCLEKKRSYCQFDSKLAQIVQQQGRNGQLHISFGSSKHPDCRGITVDELQQIKFDQLDLTNFYEDLMNNQKIPDSGALTEKVKEQIADQLRQAGK